ncbi:MAG: fatty acid desaturase family protein [Myxococcota bacterium]
MPPRPIDTTTLRELSTLKPGMGALWIAREWAMILGAAVLCWSVWHPLLYAATVIFIGARQHALGILVHEAAHYRLAVDRRVNDWLSELFCAAPLLLISTENYRANHREHHLHVNTDDDPDWRRKQGPHWRFPRAKGPFLRWVGSYLLGWGLVQSLLIVRSFADPSRRAAPPRRHRLRWARRGLLVALIAGVTLADGWAAFGLLWIVPLVTWTQLILHVRSIAEHFGFERGATRASQSRTTIASWWERLLIAPCHVGYHNEHHLYPSVPAYNLPALHRLLMRNPAYAREVHISRSYTHALLECVH